MGQYTNKGLYNAYKKITLNGYKRFIYLIKFLYYSRKII